LTNEFFCITNAPMTRINSNPSGAIAHKINSVLCGRISH
jgi:hypothetical protein